MQGLVATGPRRGCRVLRFGTEPEDGEATIKSKRCAEVGGFNLHANVRVRANDREGIEHLCRYLARPPIANDRLQQLPDGGLGRTNLFESPELSPVISATKAQCFSTSC